MQADLAGLARLEEIMAAHGYAATRFEGPEVASGPDFLRFESGPLIVEVQVAKTELQRALIPRAVVAEDGVRVATPEDLIVLELIAGRPKDEADLSGLLALPDLGWGYVERRAAEWEVLERLQKLRQP